MSGWQRRGGWHKGVPLIGRTGRHDFARGIEQRTPRAPAVVETVRQPSTGSQVRRGS